MKAYISGYMQKESMVPNLNLGEYGVHTTARDAMNRMSSPAGAMAIAGGLGFLAPLLLRRLGSSVIPEGTKYYIPGRGEVDVRKKFSRIPTLAAPVTGLAAALLTGMHFIEPIREYGFGRAKDPGDTPPGRGIGAFLGIPWSKRRHESRVEDWERQRRASRRLGDKHYDRELPDA